MMGSKAKTTTGWRKRYLVERYMNGKVVYVRLLRGRVKKGLGGTMLGLVTDRRGGKWRWENILSYTYLDVVMLEGDSPDEMMAMVATLRLQGWTIRNGVPTW